MIHAKSRRAEGPYVALNCAILAPERFEAELFGVEAGHGAQGTGRKIGVLERAHGGTLVLDEVSDMPLETQGKIARVLQDQSFERVGGNVRVKVDIRVLATTAKDLAAEAAAGHFREDLYYRLAVVPLRVPSLKERREDIPALAEEFLTRASETSGLPARSLGSDAIAALQAHDWPGNVRQLRNVMDWLMIMRSAETDCFHAEHLPTELSAHAPRALAIDPAADLMALPLREARDVFETQYLQAQLLRYGGNISRTASFVGMERSALHRKLKQLGIGADEKLQA
jgi:two-component system nitrogen regulation response regulator NtrX